MLTSAETILPAFVLDSLLTSVLLATPVKRNSAVVIPIVYFTMAFPTTPRGIIKCYIHNRQPRDFVVVNIVLDTGGDFSLVTEYSQSK